MTQMLASVANAEEALVALEAGVDIIDLKNPAEGALGALPLPVIVEILAVVDGRKPITATIGDLAMEPELLLQSARDLKASGVGAIKIGFFGVEGHRECIRALQPLIAEGLRVVAVLFADQNPDFKLLPEFKQAGFHSVMLDTANKGKGCLLDFMSPSDLLVFVSVGHAHGLLPGLAGSLRLEHVLTLTTLNPEYLGFRGAISAGGKRNSPISISKVKEIKALLYKSNKALKNTFNA